LVDDFACTPSASAGKGDRKSCAPLDAPEKFAPRRSELIRTANFQYPKFGSGSAQRLGRGPGCESRLAAPAVAKSRTQEHTNAQAPAYLNDMVIQNGRVVGADPDSHIRFQIRRDN
jgi:hypothetical protein